ncbi:MAG: CD225/dispanin family protein [Thermoguttaceae bacterium]|jgi:hypothetical protein
MRCPLCGADNTDASKYCQCCGVSLAPIAEGVAEAKQSHDAPRETRDPDYLAWSVVMGVVCCVPYIAIFPIVYAISARGHFARGHYDVARYQARRARGLFWFALFFGLAINSFYAWTHRAELVQRYYEQLSQMTDFGADPAPESMFGNVVEETEEEGTEAEEGPVDPSEESDATEPSEASVEEGDSTPPEIDFEPNDSSESVESRTETQSLSDFLKKDGD